MKRLKNDSQEYTYPEWRLIPIALVYTVLYRKEYRSVDTRDVLINIENKIRNIAIFKGIYRK